MASSALGDICRAFSTGFQAAAKIGGAMLGGISQVVSLAGLTGSLSNGAGRYSFGYSRIG